MYRITIPITYTAGKIDLNGESDVVGNKMSAFNYSK